MIRAATATASLTWAMLGTKKPGHSAKENRSRQKTEQKNGTQKTGTFWFIDGGQKNRDGTKKPGRSGLLTAGAGPVSCWHAANCSGLGRRPVVSRPQSG